MKQHSRKRIDSYYILAKRIAILEVCLERIYLLFNIDQHDRRASFTLLKYSSE